MERSSSSEMGQSGEDDRRSRVLQEAHNTIHIISMLAVIFSLFISVPDISAATLLAQKILSGSAANQATLAAITECKKNGYRVSAAVVDQSGVIQSQVRGDGAGVHTIDSSRRKAYTAVSMGRPTQAFAELVSKHPDLHALGDMNDSILLLGGGFPIKINGKIVGGIGVGGAPGAHLDEACARAGLKALGADLYLSSKAVR